MEQINHLILKSCFSFYIINYNDLLGNLRLIYNNVELLLPTIRKKLIFDLLWIIVNRLKSETFNRTVKQIIEQTKNREYWIMDNGHYYYVWVYVFNDQALNCVLCIGVKVSTHTCCVHDGGVRVHFGKVRVIAH